DRLAARGVDTESIAWDARRVGHSPWQVVAMFSSGERIREATWAVALSARIAHALDDEARWRSETDLDSVDGPRRHLQAVKSTPVYDVEADEGAAEGLNDSLQELDAAIAREAEDDSQESTAALLDELNAHRGVRPDAIDSEEDVHEPMLWEDPPAAHPPASHPQDVPESPEVLSEPKSAGDAGGEKSESSGKQQQPRRKSRRGRRTSVPSWDEIVFGAKNDCPGRARAAGRQRRLGQPARQRSGTVHSCAESAPCIPIIGLPWPRRCLLSTTACSPWAITTTSPM